MMADICATSIIIMMRTTVLFLDQRRGLKIAHMSAIEFVGEMSR